MNPSVLTRLEQLELEWQQRLLRQPSSGQWSMTGHSFLCDYPAAAPVDKTFCLPFQPAKSPPKVYRRFLAEIDCYD